MFRIGTYFSHVSLILLIVGFITGSYFGFHNTNFVVAEGTKQDVGYNTNLSLYLESFVAEYYDTGVPQDYRSQVKLYENGTEVKSAVIRVNHPLSYKGIRFYQSFFGSTVKVQVKGANEEILMNETFPLTQVLQSGTSEYYAGGFELPQTNLTGRFIISATNGGDAVIGKGELAVQLIQGNQVIAMEKINKGMPQKINELEFTYIDDASYSGFQIRYDPGDAIIWIASTLFILSIVLVMYFPYKQIWVLVKSEKETYQTDVRFSAPRSLNASEEFDTLMNELRSKLPTTNI